MTGNLRPNYSSSHCFPKSSGSFRTAGLLQAALSIALLAPFLMGTVVHAQATGTGGGQSAPPAGGADPGATTVGSGTTAPDYKIAEDDVVDVQVIDHPDVNRSYNVPVEGIIDVPLVGELKVLHMTLRELKKTLVKAYSKQFYNPDIILSARPTQMFVNVVGVAHNGKFPLKHNEHVLEVIASAGGLPLDRPENYKATLIRNTNSEAIPIDLVKIYPGPNNVPSENIVVNKDDTLYIEEKAAASTTIQVVGQVNRPGVQAFPRDGSILTVLQSTGGPTAGAALSQARILRGDKVIPIDLRNYQNTGFVPTETLQPGDSLVVPENKNVYFLYGAGAAGVRPYPDDKKLTVFSAYGYASGSTEGVDLHKVTLLHPVPGGQDQKYVIDVQYMLKSGDMAGDRPIVPNDVIVVPTSSRPKGVQLQELLGILGSLAGAVGIYYLFK